MAIRLPFFLLLFLGIFFDLRAHNAGSAPRYTENLGQWHENIRFKAKLASGYLYAENDGLKYYLFHPNELAALHGKAMYPDNDRPLRAHVYKIKFEGAETGVQLSATETFSDYENYFIGKDPRKWRSKVKSYQKVSYNGLYPKIDAVLYSETGKVKYDFIIKPGGNSDHIKLAYSGAEKIYLKDGKLHVVTSVNELIEHIPIAYQNIGSEKRTVKCEYRMLNDTSIGFHFPEGYNNSFEVVIDPVLVFSTYTGSFADNWGMTATYDDLGNMYSGGIVHDDGTYPVSVGAVQVFFGGKATTFGNNSLYWGADMAIIKYNPNGTQRIYATYLGGRNNELPTSLIVNKNGELWIQGITRSDNFPVTATAFDRTFNGNFASDGSSGDIDIVVSKLNKDCTALIGSTYIGGSGLDGINNLNSPLHFFYADDSRGEIIIDPADNCYIITTTESFNFPVTPGAIKTSLTGNSDAVICKFNNDLSILEWATFFGGNNWDSGYNIERHFNGNLYITGGTVSNNLPTPSNAFRMSFSGGRADGYVFALTPDGKRIAAGTYIGTNNYDQTYFVETDDDGNIYFIGHSLGNYPTFGTAFNMPSGRQFISKMKPDLSSMIFSLRFGTSVARSTPEIAFTAFLVDMCQNIYVTGWGGPSFPGQGTTNGLPITPNAIQQTTDGSDFYMMVLEKNATRLWYATYFGGNRSGDHVDGGTSRFDKYGIVYHSVCASCGGGSLDDFPTTQGVWSRTNNASNCNNGSFKFDFQILDATIAEFKYDTITNQGCVPFIVNFTNQSLGAESYEWDFGDGSPVSNEVNPTHTYTIPGIYTVRLVAVNNNKCNKSDTTVQLVFVYAPARAKFDVEPKGCSFAVDFKNTTSGGTTYIWDFGDGTRANVYQPPPHTYRAAGTYRVKLIVNTNSFCIDSLVIPVTITAEPFADFDYTPDACVPLARFINRSTVTTDYLWQFGDGNTSSVRNPIHTYARSGTYPVTLIVSSGANCADTVIQEVTVTDNQTVPGLLSGILTICLGERTPRLTLSGHSGQVLNWEASKDDGRNWENIGKEGLLSVQAGPISVDTWFRVQVQNRSCNIVPSPAFKVTVLQNPNAGVLTSNITASCGQPVSPILTLSRFAGNILRWESSTDEGENWQTIPHTLPLYQPPSVTRTTAFRAVIRSAAGNCPIRFSNVLRVVFADSTVAGSLSPHQTICLGQRSPRMTLSGHSGTVLRWQASKNNGQSWENLGKEGLTSMQPNPLSITTWFRVIVGNANCLPKATEPVIITVVRRASAGKISPDRTVCASEKQIQMNVSGLTAEHYRWETSFDSLNWSPSTENLPSLTVNLSVPRIFFRVRAENSFCGPVFSNVSRVTVVPEPVAGKLSSDVTICLGQRSPRIFLTGQRGSILGWETSKDSTRTVHLLGKADESDMQPHPLSVNTWFRAKIGTNFCEAVYTDWMKVTVLRNAAGGQVTGSAVICAGNPAPALRLTGTSGRVLNWQSSFDGNSWNNLPHTLNTFNPGKLTRTTFYRAVVSGNQRCGNVFSGSAKIEVQNAPFSAGSLTASAVTVCKYGSVKLKLENYDGLISHWETSEDGITWSVFNYVLPEYLAFNIQKPILYFRVTLRQPACGTVIKTAPAVIRMIPPQGSYSVVADKSVLCPGNNRLTLSLNPVPNSEVKISWYVSYDEGTNFSQLPDTLPVVTLTNVASSVSVKALLNFKCESILTKALTTEVLAPVSVEKEVKPACNGFASLQLTAAGGSGGRYEYQLNNFPKNRTGSFTEVPFGNYTFTVTDGAGCTLTDTVNISYTVPSPQILLIDRLTPFAARVSWTGGTLPSGLAYRLKFRALGTARWNVIIGLQVPESGIAPLLPATEYEAQVEIYCTAGVNTPPGQTPALAVSDIRNFRSVNNASCRSVPPTTPYGLRVITITSDSVLVRWESVTDMQARQGYILSYGDANDNPNGWIQRVICHPDTQMWIKNLAKNTRIGVRVRSNCSNCTTAFKFDDNRSLWSAPIFFTTPSNRNSELPSEQQLSFRVYPNPAGNTVYIRYKKSSDINIYDITGKLVYSEKLSGEAGEKELNLTNFSSGVYAIRFLMPDGQEQVLKFVKISE